MKSKDIINNLTLFYQILSNLNWEHMNDIHIFGGIPRRLIFDDFENYNDIDIDISLPTTDKFLKFSAFIEKHFDNVEVGNLGGISFNVGNFKYEAFIKMHPKSKSFLLEDWFFNMNDVERSISIFSITSINHFYFTLVDFLKNNKIKALLSNREYEIGEYPKEEIEYIQRITPYQLLKSKSHTFSIRTYLRELFLIYKYKLNMSKDCIDKLNILGSFLAKTKSIEEIALDIKDTIFKKIDIKNLDNFLVHIRELDNQFIKELKIQIQELKDEDYQYKHFGHFRLKNYSNTLKDFDKRVSINIDILSESFNNKDLLKINDPPNFYVTYRINDVEDYYEIGWHNGKDWERINVPVELTRKIDILFSKEKSMIYETTTLTSREKYIEKNINYQFDKNLDINVNSTNILISDIEYSTNRNKHILINLDKNSYCIFGKESELLKTSYNENVFKIESKNNNFEMEIEDLKEIEYFPYENELHLNGNKYEFKIDENPSYFHSIISVIDCEYKNCQPFLLLKNKKIKL